ncbi:MAG: hypothetical protein AAFR11_04725 [Pseudomonadota bacterium]
MKRREALIGFLNPIAVALVVAGLIGADRVASQFGLIAAGLALFGLIWLILED